LFSDFWLNGRAEYRLIFKRFTDWLLRQGVGYSFADFFFCGKKFDIWGQNIFFQICLKKQRTPWPSFFDILTSFGVHNVCALFREIE